MDTPLSREVEVFHREGVTRVVELIDTTFVMTPEMWVTLRPKLSRYIRDFAEYTEAEAERSHKAGYDEGFNDGEDHASQD